MNNDMAIELAKKMIDRNGECYLFRDEIMAICFALVDCGGALATARKERDAMKADAAIGALVRKMPVDFLLRHSVNLDWSLEVQIGSGTHVLQSADDPRSALDYAGEDEGNGA